jgi:hypothetical protein
MIFIEFKSLLGKVLTKINVENDEIHFYTKHEHYVLRHDQDCCESVYIESINGDINDLVGDPILLAEEASNHWNASDDARVMHALMPRDPLPNSDESYTWTFYKIATIKGYVDIRWYGSSNGYYSESVSFHLLDN